MKIRKYIQNISNNSLPDIHEGPYVRSAWTFFQETERFVNETLNTDEGIGQFAHIWIASLPDNISGIDMFDSFAELARWREFLLVTNKDISYHKVVVHVFTTGLGYYVWFTAEDKQNLLPSLLIKSAEKALADLRKHIE